MKKQSFVTIGTVLMLLILGGFWSSTDPDIFKPARAAPADQIINPAVIAVDPMSAPNDLNTPITITGADFATDLSGMPPTVSLGNVDLEDITWVDSTTLTATVPWALDAGVYTLTVTNPDGGTASLSDALTITQSIGQWNGGNMFGGEVRQVLLKPDNPSTVYAAAYSVGLFRSRDAGEHWEYTGYNKYSTGEDSYFVDPNNPSRLYFLSPYGGLYRSDDEGDTWTAVFEQTKKWPDGRSWSNAHAFISPHNSQLLFFSSVGNWSSDAVGLLISTDGGASWSIVSDMADTPVYSLGFHPTDPQKIVLGTNDGRVFQSTDGGNHWSEVSKPPLNGVGIVAYNPFTASDEIWISGAWIHEDEPDIFKSADSALTGWTKVTPADCTRGGATAIKFTSATSVYIGTGWGWGYHTSDGGSTWDHFGNTRALFDITFTQSDPNVIYTTDDRYGIQKSIDGGVTWEVKNQGLTGMVTRMIEASPQDPRRVYATFESWPGVFRSSDGATSWEFIPTFAGGRIVRVDPTDPNLVYSAGDAGFYKSIDGGTTWTVQTDQRNGNGFACSFEMDPFQPGHFLVAVCSGVIANTGLFSSADYGQTWEQMDVPSNFGMKIAFDSAHEGVVYLTHIGGMFRSEDHGVTWEQIPKNIVGADRFYDNVIAIATHPKHIIVVAGVDGGVRRSLDGGNTWTSVGTSCNSHSSRFMFVDGDSARFYASSSPQQGLFMSADGLNTCTRAGGALGYVNVTALDYSMLGDQPVIYAATTGGSAVTASAGAQALANDSELVKAGIYRYVQQSVTGLPNIPVLAAPANAVIVNHYTPLLDWSDVTANYHYQVQVDDNADFSTPLYHVKNLKTSEYQFSDNLTRGATYYWRIRSLNVMGGTKGWSQVWSFRIGDVPAAFSKRVPLNNTVNQPVILTLKWAKSDGITPVAYYEYCYDTTDDNNCASWRSTSLYTSAELRGLLPEQTYYWHVRAVNYFGVTTSNSNTWYSFTTGPTMTDFYDSQLTNDGWTLESSEFSNLASTKSNVGTLRVGDDAKNRQYRSLLYFDTSTLPNNVVIAKVTLKIKQASIAGANPFNTHGDLLADMAKGFFGKSALENADFQAKGVPRPNVGQFTPVDGEPDWYQLVLSPANFQYVNLNGVTQFRLRFAKDDDNDRKADFISFFSGDDATSPPQLIIEYATP